MFREMTVFHFARLAGILVLASIVGGCSAMLSKSGELTTPPQRLQLGGASFLPPNETGWFVAQRSPQVLTLIKPGRLEGDTYLIEASLLTVKRLGSTAELTRFFKAAREKDASPPRFRLKSHALSEQNIGGAQCVMSYMLAEDREPNVAQNIYTAMLLETSAVICPQPGDAGTSIVLNYSHRSYPEDQDRALQARARSVLDTLQFAER